MLPAELLKSAPELCRADWADTPRQKQPVERMANNNLILLAFCVQQLLDHTLKLFDPLLLSLNLDLLRLNLSLL